MKKYIIHILTTVCLLFSLASCSDYLDVTPSDKQTAEQLYATKSGFYTASNGIYDALSSDALYGKHMTWEAIELMSKRYSTTKCTQYMKDLASNSYTTSYASPVLSDIWQNAYEVILAANLLIDQVEKQSGVLTETEANILRGEMLTVRAFLHLDMLRLFGPTPLDGTDQLSIPYNESTNIAVLDLLPMSEVVSKILSDLDEAEQLLANDPIIENGPMMSEVDGESVQLRYRQFRFNYYTTIALKARAYLWIGDKENALAQALKLINDSKVAENFPFVDPNKLLANTSNPDRVFSSEVLMGVYDKDRDQVFTDYFSSDAPSTQRLQPYSTFVMGGQVGLFYNIMVGSETTDYRYQSQWELASGTAEGFILTKYKEIDKPDVDDEDSEYYYSRMIPLIRLSEMYYIAAECEPNSIDGAKWYNTIRAHRGCITIPDEYVQIYVAYGYWDEYFPLMLSQEYLREFYGEGQWFYFTKRREIATGYGVGVVSAYDNGSSMSMDYLTVQPPLPEDEMK